jgi:hypothetical protein
MDWDTNIGLTVLHYIVGSRRQCKCSADVASVALGLRVVEEGWYRSFFFDRRFIEAEPPMNITLIVESRVLQPSAIGLIVLTVGSSIGIAGLTLMSPAHSLSGTQEQLRCI